MPLARVVDDADRDLNQRPAAVSADQPQAIPSDVEVVPAHHAAANAAQRLMQARRSKRAFA